MILYGFAGYGYIIIATYFPVIIQSLPKSAMTEHLWSLVGLGAMFSCYLWVFIERKIGAVSALFFNLILQSTFILFSIFHDSMSVLIISSLGFGLTFMGTVSLVMPLARRLKPLKIFNLVGLVALTYGIGQILGPIMTSFIKNMTGSLLLAIISGAIESVECHKTDLIKNTQQKRDPEGSLFVCHRFHRRKFIASLFRKICGNILPFPLQSLFLRSKKLPF